MTRHSIDDYGHTTQTAPAMITDEWAAQHLPLAQVALAAAVPLIEAEVREKVAREIEAEAERTSLLSLPGHPDLSAFSGYTPDFWAGMDYAARIARGNS